MKNDYERIIGALALQATNAVEIFNKKRKDCSYHTLNTLTKEHNCFHGNTKTECNIFLCPLKKEKSE